MKECCHFEYLNHIDQLLQESRSNTSWFDLFDSSLAITVIICSALAYISYQIIKYYKQRDNVDETRKFEERIAKLENATKDADNKKEESTSEKERRYFLNFCYEMVRSNDEDNQQIKLECWKFLTNTFVANDKIIDITKDDTDNDLH